MYHDDYDGDRRISRFTHIQLHDLIEKVNLNLKRLGSQWILRPRPNGLSTSICTKNLLTDQNIPLLEHCTVDYGYAYVSGYGDALINLQIDGIDVVCTTPLVDAVPIPRKKVLGIF